MSVSGPGTCVRPSPRCSILDLHPGPRGPVYGPGKYAVQLRYTNDPGKHTAASPEIAALLARSSACDVTSAPLTIKVP